MSELGKERRLERVPVARGRRREVKGRRERGSCMRERIKERDPEGALICMRATRRRAEAISAHCTRAPTFEKKLRETKHAML